MKDIELLNKTKDLNSHIDEIYLMTEVRKDQNPEFSLIKWFKSFWIERAMKEEAKLG